ncbi:sigma-70 family RNA polymerase sigma factor [Pedobacter sp. L105]|uniref:sigma-70 family RNA polymerase sigma factor n=1 Tax=Pedobacter sp. L105 TaxID=1641871 RepID=UPI00131DA453|nr:sigma-70 family RNA polymerase sigma factor [Pedobacter sp. L105]
MLKINRQELTVNKPESVRCLYDKYGGMLLGYIYEIVRDRKLAEEYLVQVFCDLSKQINEMDWKDTNSWCQLQSFARNKITSLTTAEPVDITIRADKVVHNFRNRYLEQMTALQKQVFYRVYYYGRSIAAISVELNETDDVIRKTLKEAFAIMKKSGGN